MPPPKGKIIRVPEVPKEVRLEKPVVLRLSETKTTEVVNGKIKSGGFSGPPEMKILPDLGKTQESPSTVFHLKLDPHVNKEAPKLSLRKRITTVSATVTAVIAMFLGAVTVENYFRLKRRADPGETPELADSVPGLKTNSWVENNGFIDMHQIQSLGDVETPKGEINIQVETLYLEYNRKAILTVTTQKPVNSQSLEVGPGEFMTEVTISGVSRPEAELLHKQFSNEYGETGSANEAFEWLKKSPWGSRVDP